MVGCAPIFYRPSIHGVAHLLVHKIEHITTQGPCQPPGAAPKASAIKCFTKRFCYVDISAGGFINTPRRGWSHHQKAQKRERASPARNISVSDKPAPRHGRIPLRQHPDHHSMYGNDRHYHGWRLPVSPVPTMQTTTECDLLPDDDNGRYRRTAAPPECSARLKQRAADPVLPVVPHKDRRPARC